MFHNIIFFRNKLQIAKVDMMPIIPGFRIKSGTGPPRVDAVYTNICMYVHPFRTLQPVYIYFQFKEATKNWEQWTE